MAGKSYRKESANIDWGADQATDFSLEQINCGSLLRIADATEKMARNYTALQNEVNDLKERRDDLDREKQRLYRRLSAMRGVVTRLKKRR